MTKQGYHNYLKTDAWAEVSNAVKKRAGHRCQLCNSSESLNAHHRSYDHVGDEMGFLNDLICLCEKCHKKFHDADRLPKLVERRTASRALPQPIPAERDLLVICLKLSDYGRAAAAAVPRGWIDHSHVAGRTLVRVLDLYDKGYLPGDQDFGHFIEAADEKALVGEIFFSAELSEDERFEAGRILVEGIRRLRTQALTPMLRKIELDLATHHAGDAVDAISLLKTRSDLQRQLRDPIVIATP